jgi:hypothetical protein
MLSGCVAAIPTTQETVTQAVRIDVSMLPYANSILDGAAIWEPLGGHLIIDDTADRTITCGDSGEALAYEGAVGIVSDCGLLAVVTGIEEVHAGEVDSNPVGTGATALLAHELGHLYGLPHETLDPAGLMYPSGCCGQPAHLTDTDVNLWWSIHPKAVQ